MQYIKVELGHLLGFRLDMKMRTKMKMKMERFECIVRLSVCTTLLDMD